MIHRRRRQSRKSNFLKKSVLALVSICITVAAAELTLGYLVSRGDSFLTYFPRKTISKPQNTTTYKMEIPNQLDQDPQYSHPAAPDVIADADISGGHAMWLEPVVKPRANFSGRMIKTVRGTGKVLYDVEMNIDEHSRRVARPRNSSRDSSKHIFVFGCSIVFGEGVNDAETIPWQMNLLTSDYEAYNVGFSGSGVNDLIARAATSDQLQGVPQTSGIGLYILMENHVQRTLGSLSVVGRWGYDLAVVEKKEGRWTFTGRRKDRQYFRTLAYRWAVKSNIVRFLGVDWPVLKDNHYADFAERVAGLRDEYQRQTSADNPFVVVLYPQFSDSVDFEAVKKHLDRLNIPFLDYSSRSMIELSEGYPRVEFDGHPSGAANKKFAEILVRDLRLRKDGPLLRADLAR